MQSFRLNSNVQITVKSNSITQIIREHWSNISPIEDQSHQIDWKQNFELSALIFASTYSDSFSFAAPIEFRAEKKNSDKMKEFKRDFRFAFRKIPNVIIFHFLTSRDNRSKVNNFPNRQVTDPHSWTFSTSRPVKAFLWDQLNVFSLLAQIYPLRVREEEKVVTTVNREREGEEWNTR